MKRQALNKFNAPEMLAALKKALEVAGLDDTVKEMKRRGFFKMINDAWVSRDKMASQVVGRWITAAGMSVPEFWAVVDKIGWGTKTTDYHAIEKAIMLKFSPQQAAALNDIRGKLHSALYDRLDHWEASEEGDSFGTGDDGFGDLINHIIGLGRSEYDAVMKDPKRGWERAQKDKYTESFSYAFPSRSDYASLNIKHYTRWANKLIHSFKKGILGNRSLKSMHKDAQTIIAALELMSGGQVDAFINTEKAVLGLFKKMKRNYEAKLRAMGGVPGRSWDDDDDDNPLTSGAFLENLYHDVRRFAEKTPIKLASRVARRWEAQR